jgi:hypothetical protein
VTFLRLISPALRSGLFLLAGTALITLPYALGVGSAGIVTGVAVGSLMVALALAGTESTGRGTLPLSAQAVYDRGVALGLVLVAIAFGVADETAAALVFGAAGLAGLLVSSITRYSARPA